MIRPALDTSTDYAPTNWNRVQRAMHTPTALDAALHYAYCLAGGWYRRPVTVSMRIVGGHEVYTLHPADVPPPDGCRRVYTVTPHTDERDA